MARAPATKAVCASSAVSFQSSGWKREDDLARIPLANAFVNRRPRLQGLRHIVEPTMLPPCLGTPVTVLRIEASAACRPCRLLSTLGPQHSQERKNSAKTLPTTTRQNHFLHFCAQKRHIAVFRIASTVCDTIVTRAPVPSTRFPFGIGVIGDNSEPVASWGRTGHPNGRSQSRESSGVKQPTGGMPTGGESALTPRRVRDGQLNKHGAGRGTLPAGAKYDPVVPLSIASAGTGRRWPGSRAQ